MLSVFDSLMLYYAGRIAVMGILGAERSALAPGIANVSPRT
jgi:hypothetical protein